MDHDQRRRILVTILLWILVSAKTLNCSNASMILSSTVWRSQKSIHLAKTTAAKLLRGKKQQQQHCERTTTSSKQAQRSFHSSCVISMMPEGPEVRSVVDQLQAGVGRRLINIQFVSGRYVRGGPPDGFRAFAMTMTEKQPEPMDWYEELMNEPEKEEDLVIDIIKELNCKGKFIYIILDNGGTNEKKIWRDTGYLLEDFQRSIWITLGTSGHFLSEKAMKELQEKGKPFHVRWYLELMDVSSNNHTDTDNASSSSSSKTKTTTKIYFSDPLNYGTLKFCLSRQALEEKLQRLGPDILTTCTEQDFLNVIAGHKNQDTNVCKFLMNQSNISGVGNYILSESLYRANIDPFASLSELNLTQQRDLFRELHAVTAESYRSQTKSSSDQDTFQFQCFRQQRCKQRGDPVRKEREGPHGRTIWYTDKQLFMPRSERKPPIQTTQVATRDMSTAASAAIAVTRKRTAVAEADTPGNAKLAAILGTSVPTGRPRERAVTSSSTENQALDGEVLASSLLSGITDPGWSEALCDTLQSSKSFQELAVFLEEERLQGATIYPPRSEIFAALNLCPLDKVKLLILGQDPYHGAGQGHGLAFSVRKGVKPPPSLQNIFKEAMEDVGIEAPGHGNLEHWAKQGVLLLNAVLTVREGEANSHSGKGWEEVTDAIIQQVCAKHKKDDNDGLVFLLWGNAALKKVGKAIESDSHHTIIQASHPSPLGATKTNAPFLGSKCFSRANTALIDMGKEPIDWNVDP